MVKFIIFSGVVALISGCLLLWAPKVLKSWNDRFVRRIAMEGSVSIDDIIYALRTGFGISLIFISILLFFVGYYLIERY